MFKFTTKQEAAIARRIRVCDEVAGGRFAFSFKGLDYTCRLAARATKLIDIQAF